MPSTTPTTLFWDQNQLLQRCRILDAVNAALTGLLGECDTPIVRIATDNPGDIVYRDDMQIVAMPRPNTPVRWH